MLTIFDLKLHFATYQCAIVTFITDNTGLRVYITGVGRNSRCVICGSGCHGSLCRSCTLTTEKEIQGQRRSAIKGLYGLPWREYVYLYESNDGKCHICGEPLALYKNDDEIEVARVDHDHDSGVVRGLLCNQCNLMLGAARDSIGVLCEAISYLNRHRDESWLEEDLDLD